MNEVVAAVTFEGNVYIFTRNGDVYRMWIDRLTMTFTFTLIHKLFT